MSNQQQIIDRAQDVMPGGGFGNFDAGVFIREGKGSRVWDEDGNEFIDYLIGSGPMLLGHGHPEVVEAVQEQVTKGMTFFTNNARGIELAEAICDAVPCAEQVRYVSTGSEADMFAIRLGRAVSGKDKVVKFEGGYHGMSAEGQMSLAPTKLVNFPVAVPDSAGIPDGVRDEMLIAPYNDLDFFNSLVAEHGDDIGAVIVEPFQRIIPPEPGFLEGLREVCTKRGIVLIYDEVVTGFRFAYGGAQEHYGVIPDVCTLGKVIGGGFPLAAIAGKADMMACFDKSKAAADKLLQQTGTLSGNPVAAVAGLKTLEILRRPGQYEKLRADGTRLIDAFSKHLGDAGHDHQVVGDPVLFDVLFTPTPVKNYRDVVAADAPKNQAFNAVLRDNGILKTVGKTYPSMALTDRDLEETETAIEVAAKAV